jgi:sugar phosphate isomerase/epimerase
MPPTLHRRGFLGAVGTLAAAPFLPAPPLQAAPKFKLGTVTYLVAAEWDLPTLLETCRATGFEAIELRTTHAHKVEPALTADERREARKRIADSGILLWGLGTVCEFHSQDPAEVRRNVEEGRAFCKLAADLGARGIKVRPNGLPEGVEPARTLEQIGRALGECGRAAADQGVEVWVEVHGVGTSLPENMRAILDRCGHPNVGICWNSNETDVRDGSVRAAFDLLKKDIKSCHINELWSGYPWRELFAGLRSIDYDRVTLMEVEGVPEAPGVPTPEAAIRFMRYYAALWRELAR